MDKTQNVQNFDQNQPMFSISVVADILKVHQRTLRIYDNERLLIPSRSPKNRRLYSLNDIEKGKFIQYLTRESGLNLAGIKIIIHLLKQQNITQGEQLNYIGKIVSELGISLETRTETGTGLSKRRKKSINSAD